MNDAKKPAVAIESALKHGFTKDEVERAWMNAQGSWRMVRKDKWPPHFMAFGRIGNRDVEMIAYSIARRGEVQARVQREREVAR